MQKTKKNLFVVLLLCIMASCFSLAFAANTTSVKAVATAPTATQISAIKGVNLSLADSTVAHVIGTNDLTAYNDDNTINEYVIIQYKLKESAPNGGRETVMWGQGFNTSFFDNVSRKGAMLYRDSANVFLNSSKVGKYVTVIQKRTGYSINMFVSDVAPEFSHNGTALTVSNGTSFSSEMPNNWYGHNGSAYFSDGSNVVASVKYSTVFGMTFGNGTAILEDVKIYDETGANLGLRYTSSISEVVPVPTKDQIDAIKGKDIWMNSDLNVNAAFLGTNDMVPYATDSTGSQYVIIQYKLKEAQASQGREALAWGQAFTSSVYNNGDGCFQFDDSSNVFLDSAYVGKYVTIVQKRSGYGVKLYVSDSIPTFSYVSGALVCESATDITSERWPYVQANITGSLGGTAFNGYTGASVNTSITKAKVFAINMGNGTARLEDVRAFDENCNDLGVRFMGDFYHKIEKEEMVNGDVSCAVSTAYDGQDVTLRVNPAEHYKLGALSIDGADVTGKVVNNAYVLKVTADTTISATFARDIDSYGVWVEEVPATVGHSGKVGHYYCATCNKYFDADFDEITDIFTPALEGIAYVSLSLQGDISINFYVAINTDDQVTANDGAIAGVETEYMGEEYFVFSIPVHAKDYKVKVSLSVDGYEISAEYSVEDYIDQLPDTNEAYALVQSLKDYCEAARIFFAKETAIATENLAVSLEDYKPVVNGEDEAITLQGATLDLESTTSINVYFTAKNVEGLTFKVQGVDVVPVAVDGETDLYVISIDNILSSDLDKTYVINIGGYTVSYSALSYAYGVLTQSSDVALNNVAKALYAYCVQANVYFAENA